MTNVLLAEAERDVDRLLERIADLETELRRGEALPWRTGNSVGRTIYDSMDRLIGVMDTPALAAQVVAAVNERGLAP